MITLHSTARWLVLAGCLGGAGCQPRDGRPETKERELMHTSFEEMGGWSTTVHETLTTEKAHSGRVSARVDKLHQYSPTYRTELGRLCTHRPRRFTLSGWAWVPSAQDDAVLVVAIANAGDLDHPVYRKDVYLNDIGPYQQWKFVSRDLELPNNIYSNSQLVIYLWHSSATDPVYADDLRLTELW